MDPVIHFEMPYDDRDRMAAFYETAFGWKTEKLGPEMGDYVVATTNESSPSKLSGTKIPGAINGGFFQRKADWPAQHPSVVIAVSDIHASIKQVAAAGGEVLGEPMAIPGIGLYVSFMDSEGNRVSMLEPVPRSV
jgi:predicted enzyme related to lactoylglutathione lyase